MGPLRACRRDVRRYCTGLDRTGGPAAACLRQYYVNLSQACRAALNPQPQPGAASAEDTSAQ